MNSKKIRTIGAVLLAVLVLVYVGYQGYLATHRSIQTETAMYGQVSDVLQAQSFIIRNEQVIDESANGVLSYRVADGTRVAQGGVIADVFSTEEDASAQRTIEQRKSPTCRRCPSPRTTLWPTPPCWRTKSTPPWRTWLWASTRTAFPS